MRVLSVVARSYYGHPEAPEPMFLYFTQPLTDLGHEVHVFDHVAAAEQYGVAGGTERLEAEMLALQPDLVLYENCPTFREPVDTAMFRQHRDKFCIAAWNSDDEWEWPITSKSAGDFTYMVTTSPDVFRTERERVANLVMSQWGCLGTYVVDRPRDIPFSFAGFLYRQRFDDCQVLRRRAGLQCFGKGSRAVNLGLRKWVRGLSHLGPLYGKAISFENINEIWCRSQVSYAPLKGSPTGKVIQIKSRVFDMGLSGAVMVSEKNPNLEQYYDIGTECITFDSLDECVELVAWLLRDSAARETIAKAYAARTRGDHMWTHRFRQMFRDFGIEPTEA